MSDDNFGEREIPGGMPPRRGAAAKKIPWEGCPLFPQGSHADLMVPEDRPIRIRLGVAYDGGAAWFNTRPCDPTLTREAIHRRWGPGKYRVELVAVNPESGALMRDSYLKRETIEIRPKTTVDDPDGEDDVGQEPWPITVSDEAHPEELRDEHERRTVVRDELRDAARAMRDGYYQPQGGRRSDVGGRPPGRPGPSREYPREYPQAYPDDGGRPYEGEDEPPPMPRDPPPAGFMWGFDGRRWMPVSTGSATPKPTAEESITAMLLKKLLDEPKGPPPESPDDRAARLQREADERDERAAKRRREEAEWEDRRAREKAEHDERLATMALQRDKLAAEIRALATPRAEPAVNPQEIAERAVAAVRLEHAQSENARLRAQQAAAAAQQARPLDPVAELKRRADQIAQLREVAKGLGMVEKTNEAIEAAGGLAGFSLTDFMNSEAGAVVAERGMDLLGRWLTGGAGGQTTVVQNSAPQQSGEPQSAELPPTGYPAETQEAPLG